MLARMKDLCKRIFHRRPKAERLALGILCALLIAGLTVFGMACGISAAVCDKTAERILETQDTRSLLDGEPYDCVLVLGCRVYDDGRMSSMLQDRMSVAVGLLKEGVSDRLVVSGDHATDAYDEVGAMKAYAVEQGIASSAVFQDHDGYSTYDSIARLKTVFGAKRVVIVTQTYHLYRAVYLAETLGLEAVGVSADLQSYYKQPIYDLREIFARWKDVYFGLVQPTPSGELTPVDLSGDGDSTAVARPVA